jgi:WD40 repeat protein
MGEAILIGLFVNFLFSFKDNVYAFFKSKEEREQAEFIKATLTKIDSDLKAVTNWNDEKTLERIGQKFIDNFDGNIDTLIMILNNHKLEIIKSMENRFDKVDDRLVEIIELLKRPDDQINTDRKAFVSQVEKIFRMSGEKIERNVIVNEKKIDISSATSAGFGRPDNITYIQCVHDHEVKREDVSEFINILSSVSRATGMIVSKFGFEPSALSRANEKYIVARTYDQLVSELIEFSSYMDKLIDDYEQNGVEYKMPLKKLYIEQNIIEDRTGRKDSLSNYVNEWLKDNTQNLLVILGDYGTGKTSFTLKYASELANKRKLENKGIIPVRIELKKYREAIDYDTMIVNHLSENGITPNKEAFDFLLRTGNIMLMLDAFDEMAVQVNEEVTKKNFGELCKAVNGKAKVILTCRTHYFKEHPEVKSRVFDIRAPKGFITDAGTPLYESISSLKNRKICFLQYFDDIKIREYLNNALGKKAEEAMDMLNNEKYKGLKDLATRPVLLAMIAQSYSEISKGEIIPSAAGLYEAYIQKWVDRDDEKINLTKDGKVTFAEQLAVKLWLENKNNIHYRDLSPLVNEHFKSKILAPADLEYAEHEVRASSFLTRDADGNYGFAHKSFMEFFIARKFVGEIITNQIIDFGKNKITKEIADLMSDMVKDESAMINLIRNKTPEMAGYAGANVVFILGSKRIALSNSDLSNCVLSYSNFSNFDSLAGTNFSNSYMDNISFPLRIFSNIALSSDGEYIVAGGNIITRIDIDNVIVIASATVGVVTILNSSDFSIKKEIDTKYGAYNLTYSPDGKYIVVGGDDDGVTVLNSFDFSIKKEIKTNYGAYNLTYSPDRKYIIAGGGGFGGGVIILNSSDFSIKKEIDTNGAYNLTYSPDGKYIVVGGGFGGGVTILNSSDFSIRKEIDTKYGADNLTYSPDGKYIVVSSRGVVGVVMILNSSDFSIEKEIDTKYGADNLTYSPDGKYIIIVGGFGVVTILNSPDFSIEKEIDTKYGANNLTYSLDGKYIVVVGDGGITTLNSSDFSIEKEIDTKYGAYNLTYSPDGKYIVGSGIVGSGGVTILNSSDFSIVKEIDTKYGVYKFTYSSDGKYIVGGGVTILNSSDFSIVKEIVRIACDVKGIKIDGVKGLDPVLEDALRRAM